MLYQGAKDKRIGFALDNWDAYVAQLANMPDKKLEEKLEAIHLQSALAIERKMEESIELLEIWRSQIIAARILKAENNIPDAPNEIELAIQDIETFVSRTKERNENSPPARKTKIQEEDKDQMSLFRINSYDH